MGYRFVGGDDPGQRFLLPPDARDWLPPDHLAWQLVSVAGELDLTEFVRRYRADGKSRPAYHPRLMLGLVMYCYCKGVRSSRAIEAACWDDLGARVITGNRQPDHATIARFVAGHRDAIKDLLVQTLVICARDGLLRVDVVAGDGTVVTANASKAGNATAEQLGVQIAELERALDAEVGSWFVQAAAEDATEDALFDPDPDGGDHDDRGRPAGGPGTLVHTVAKLLRRRQAQDRLNVREDQRRAEIAAQRQAKTDRWAARVAAREHALVRVRAGYRAKVHDWQARAEAAVAAGGGIPGTRPVPVEDHIEVRRAVAALAQAQARHGDALAAAAAPIPQPDKPPVANTTDPASRLIPGKNGGYLQGHNVQVIAARKQIILHIGTHDSPADTQALHPGLRAARGNLDAAGIGTPIGAALFDAGYASDTNFTTGCPDRQTILYVAVDKEARQTGRLDDGNTRNHRLASWQQMAHRLATDHGKTLYRQRGAIVEPVFAQLFNRLGRHLHYRGGGVDTELHLWASSHNLLKIMNNRLASNPLTPAPG